MEEIKKKYNNFSTHSLKELIKNASGEKHRIINEILKTRQNENNQMFLEPENENNSFIPKSKEVVPSEIISTKLNKTNKNRSNSVHKQKSKKDGESSKTPQFYKIYSLFLETYGVDAANIIAILAVKQQYYEQISKIREDGYFYQEHPKIKKMTGISTYYQNIAINILVELKIIHISPEKKGTPPKTFYHVDLERYEEIVQNLTNGEQVP
jgi:hypothetical protein